MSEGCFMSKQTEDQIRILKTIQEVKRTTSTELVQRLGEPYTSQDLGAYLTLLEQEKLLNRVQENPLTYELSTLGLVTIGALPQEAKNLVLSVPADKCFFFYTGIGPDEFTRLSACNLSDFREKVKKVDVKSLEFHIARGDIEKWIRNVLGDENLAKEIEGVKWFRLSGEPLRNRILKVIDARVKELTADV
jgi:hypothetical protein